MTVKECYAAIGGNYDEIMARFRKEERVVKFAVKFLQDPSYDLLCAAVAGRTEEAFRAAHTLKGISQNLAFTELHEASEAVTEVLRGGDFDRAELLMPQVKAAYEKTVSGIRQLAQA